MRIYLREHFSQRAKSAKCKEHRTKSTFGGTFDRWLIFFIFFFRISCCCCLVCWLLGDKPPCMTSRKRDRYNKCETVCVVRWGGGCSNGERVRDREREGEGVAVRKRQQHMQRDTRSEAQINIKIFIIMSSM